MPARIDGYRLVRPLGQDGSTFLAVDGSLNRAVVLTFLPENAEARRARIAVAGAFARASHPSLGPVHYVREGGARPYVVAAYMHGEHLDALAKPLPDARVLDIGRGLAGALAGLHAAGAAHGDVRAGRVILSDEGLPRLVGLDRARIANGTASAGAQRVDVGALLNLLGSIADRSLRERISSLSGTEEGVVTAEELRRALETLGRPTLARESLSENPYRGLRAFEREHAAVFFGREREVAELVERLRGAIRTEPGAELVGAAAEIAEHFVGPNATLLTVAGGRIEHRDARLDELHQILVGRDDQHVGAALARLHRVSGDQIVRLVAVLLDRRQAESAHGVAHQRELRHEVFGRLGTMALVRGIDFAAERMFRLVENDRQMRRLDARRAIAHELQQLGREQAHRADGQTIGAVIVFLILTDRLEIGAKDEGGAVDEKKMVAGAHRAEIFSHGRSLNKPARQGQRLGARDALSASL